MTGAIDLAKKVPGFDFLQGLMKSAGAGLPNITQWVAPTLDPKELEVRIQELRTVQFWLENNAKLLGVTLQALEVQRMTLAALQTLNVPLAGLRDALTIKAQQPAAAQEAAPARQRSSREAVPRGADSPAAPGPIDPMQWWGALTQQFTELAAKAVKDGATQAAGKIAGAVVKPALASAGGALKAAASRRARPAHSPPTFRPGTTSPSATSRATTNSGCASTSS